MNPKPKQGDRNEKDEKAMQTGKTKLGRKGYDTSKMPGVAAQDGRKSNA